MSSRNLVEVNLRITEMQMTLKSPNYYRKELSDDSLGDTPVPMPNTEVKP